MTLSLEDHLAIQAVINLYGHIIDEREFSRLEEIFTSDAVFDLSGFGGSCYEGLEAIRTMMLESTQHPLAHHATNIVITPEGKDARVLSKGLGVGNGGRVGSVRYRDQFVKTAAGWRIAHRLCDLRHPDNIPDPC